MRRFFKWFHCAMSGHPMSITHIETIHGKQWPTHDVCSCAAKRRPHFPGFLFMTWRDDYEQLPVEYPPLFGEDTH